MVQTVGSEAREALLHALDLVQQSLASGEEPASYSKEEVLDLVKEGQTELEKAKPNGIRLRAILTAVATTIQTVGSLQPAYQALKTALLPLGILLP